MDSKITFAIPHSYEEFIEDLIVKLDEDTNYVKYKESIWYIRYYKDVSSIVKKIMRDRIKRTNTI